MKRPMKMMRWIWQVPQHLLALILIALLNGERCIVHSHAVYKLRGLRAGCSLGAYILLPDRKYTRKSTVLHEYGHSRQSLYLGWLYLAIIGAPSLLHNLIYRACGRRWNYYSFPTEKWADKLGGVNRDA